MSLREGFSSGLPGLRAIRQELGLRQNYVAELVGCTAQWLSNIENGRCDCSDQLKRQIATELACLPSDLINTPRQERLKQIRLSWHKLQLAGQPAEAHPA